MGPSVEQTTTMKTFVFILLVASAFAAPSGKPQFKRGLNRIVGGQDVAPGELPYQISFQDTSFGINFHFCGASIYSQDTIICAGHCVYGEDYSPRGTKNDISLLKIGTSLKFDSYVAAIPIPTSMETFSGTALVSGWGTLTEGGQTPTILQKVTVPLVSDDACRDAYGASSILDSMMCAGEAGQDSCQGDSGGPLNCGGKLCGVVSWGYGCARPDYPGVYTEVAYFVDWILSHA